MPNQAKARGGLAADGKSEPKPKTKKVPKEPKAKKAGKGWVPLIAELLKEGESDASITGKVMEKYPEVKEWYAHNLIVSAKKKQKKAETKAKAEAEREEREREKIAA